MKDFSNETKKVRRNAVLKVILKRYSFVVWLPLLLWLSYNVGKKADFVEMNEQHYILSIIGVTIWGFIVLIMLGILGWIIIACIRDEIIIAIKEKTFFRDLKGAFKFIGELLLGICQLILVFLWEVLKTPIHLYKRIKDEKRRFQNAVEKQIRKDSNKNLGGDIEN